MPPSFKAESEPTYEAPICRLVIHGTLLESTNPRDQVVNPA